MDNYNSSQNVNEHRIWNENNVLFAIFSWFFIALIEFIAVFILKLNSEYSIILAFFLILFYTVLLFFLLEPEILREVNTRETRTIEKPIFKEVIKEIEKPVVRFVDRPVERIVEKPVIQEIEKEVPVYIEKLRDKLNIPKYDYLGSSQTKVYHKHLCRFGKLIKKKYKVSSNSEAFYKKAKYKPCKMCIVKKKKG
ncbi:hypothetical protein J4463_01470 [Candidatus Pacearchaeota archaeon]|nr:hypothetical protein [Candidatus Pacearchaeota archaeon]